ncbi:MAG TPA: hypothetical protein VF103_04800 [Polyangiaceae bacterium]
MKLSLDALRKPAARLAFGGGLAFALGGCSGTLDAGSDRPPSDTLPVGPENPVVLFNDGARDNWQGEYAVLLAQADGPPLAGLIVSTGGLWSDLDENLLRWQELITSARDSGLADLPDPIASASAPLARPADGSVESTVPNDSAGARAIIEMSSGFGNAEHPLVVATGGRLTDVADAYLLDPTVAERVIVVASLGTGFTEDGGVAVMGVPNGEMDAWADTIVVQKFRYVQVSAYYDQVGDVPDERLAELPNNPLGDWMRAKQPDILKIPVASDQVAVIAMGVSGFATGFTRVSQSGWDGELPTLEPDPNGNGWLVTESDGAAATERFWQLLSDPATYAR